MLSHCLALFLSISERFALFHFIPLRCLTVANQMRPPDPLKVN